jgi:predicted amidohydrolase
MQNLRIASVQMEHKAGDKEANWRKVEVFTSMAAGLGVRALVFPECCLTGYWFLRNLNREELTDLAEPVEEGPSAERLLSLAQAWSMMIGVGLVEKAPDGRLYNTYLVASPDGSVHAHRKLHAFVSPHIDSGDSFTVFDSPWGWRMAVLICYDCNIVENVRICALRGADLLLAPHQTGGCRSTNPHTMGIIERSLWDKRGSNPEAIEEELRGPKGRGWLMRWLPSRAHDNGMFVAFSNGVGVDDDEIRTGNASIFDPYGRILAETWRADDEMVVADLDASLLDQCTGRRWVVTRRPELYSEIAASTGRERDTREVRFDSKGI